MCRLHRVEWASCGHRPSVDVKCLEYQNHKGLFTKPDVIHNEPGFCPNCMLLDDSPMNEPHDRADFLLPREKREADDFLKIFQVWAAQDDMDEDGEEALPEKRHYDYTNMMELDHYTGYKSLSETDENFIRDIIRMLQAKFFDRWDRLNYTPPLMKRGILRQLQWMAARRRIEFWFLDDKMELLQIRQKSFFGGLREKDAGRAKKIMKFSGAKHLSEERTGPKCDICRMRTGKGEPSTGPGLLERAVKIRCKICGEKEPKTIVKQTYGEYCLWQEWTTIAYFICPLCRQVLDLAPPRDPEDQRKDELNKELLEINQEIAGNSIIHPSIASTTSWVSAARAATLAGRVARRDRNSRAYEDWWAEGMAQREQQNDTMIDRLNQAIDRTNDHLDLNQDEEAGADDPTAPDATQDDIQLDSDQSDQEQTE